MPAQPAPAKGASYSMQRRLAGAKLREFSLTAGGWEYRAREDQTLLPSHTLVAGSQNVVTNVQGRLSLVKGFTLDGASSAISAPILGSFDYFLHNGREVNVRSYTDPTSSQGVLQMRTVSGTTVTWNTVLSNLNTGLLRFTNFWDALTELKDFIMFVDGTSNVYEWSAGLTTFASSTSSSITQQTTVQNTWSLNNFYDQNFTLGDSTSQFTITNTSGTTYRYTWTSVGTNPNITATLLPIGMIMYINAQNFTAANNGVFTVTGSGANYFEITNASGVAEATKTIGTGFIDYFAKQIIGIHAGVATTYTYRGGETTATITNVTPDPTAVAYAAGDVFIQLPRQYPNAGFTFSNLTWAPSTYKNNFISTLENQIYLGSTTDNSVYVSKADNYKNFSQSSPRKPQEGQRLSLDAPPVGFMPQEKEMYIASGKDFWFQTQFILSADTTSENLTAVRLKTGSLQSAQSQELMFKDKNNVVFVSNEPVLTSLGRVSNNLQTPQLQDISHTIVNDMNVYDFTNASVKYHRNFIYVAVPAQQLIRIYNQTDPKRHFWEAPVTYPIGRFSVINGALYGHSYNSPETYKLFTGYNFNGQPIPAVANFAYNNFGTRFGKKSFTEFYIEGYINPNTSLSLGLRKDLDGCASDASFPIDGSNTNYVCIGGTTAPIGKESLGINPIGGDLSDASTLPPKFRIFKTMPQFPPFFELQPSFFNSGIDQQWEIVAFGPAINHVASIPSELKD